jgi:hypothetical protein
MSECIIIQKDHVYTVHLCCDLDDNNVIHAKLSVDLWTRYDEKFHKGVKIDAEEMNSEIPLPTSLFYDNEFLDQLHSCPTPTHVIALLDSANIL